jgi:hypothetical protein
VCGSFKYFFRPKKKSSIIMRAPGYATSYGVRHRGYALILIICTGQRSEASCAHASRSSGKVPSAMLPSIRYFSMIRLNESSGSCSNNPGQVSQHEPQLTHVARSIINFTSVLLTMVHSKSNTIKLPVVPISWHFVTRLNLKCKFFFCFLDSHSGK